MNKSLYYNKLGEEISLVEWGKLMGDRGYKIIKQDELPNGKWVSTVWLGLNHGFSDNDKILIFETMIFSSKKDFNEEYCERYSTLEEAKKGHIKIIKKAKKGKKKISNRI